MKFLLGVDEAGRGPLAGPIAVAAIRTKHNIQKTKQLFKGIRDSKKFSEKQREEWFAKFKKLRKEGILEYAVAFSGAGTIDTYGIVSATKRALARVVKKIIGKPEECKILLDGSLYAPRKYVNQKTIIRGDDHIPIIAAASIVAKVLRDRKMKRLSKKFPEYSFDIHKGYGTALHYRKLKKHGPCIIHRRSFISL
ncbi:ribonuclease HII [Candidatus Kaiserbacteria bacterium]|nr:ribonuclease HII [Candidatus Kaiserbacteria bacterium]